MERLQAFKFELMPKGEQRRTMRRFAGAWRFVFNQALAFQKERHTQGDKKLGYAQLCKLLKAGRNGPQTPWLKAAPTHPLQRALKDLERAYANFFAKRADFPRFKKKGQSDSFRYPDPKQFKLDQVFCRDKAILMSRPEITRTTNITNGHDMDTYAADAAAVVEALDLRNAVHSVTPPAAVRWPVTWLVTAKDE